MTEREMCLYRHLRRYGFVGPSRSVLERTPVCARREYSVRVSSLYHYVRKHGYKGTRQQLIKTLSQF